MDRLSYKYAYNDWNTLKNTTSHQTNHVYKELGYSQHNLLMLLVLAAMSALYISTWYVTPVT